MSRFIRFSTIGVVQRGLDVGRRRVDREQGVSRRHGAVYNSRCWEWIDRVSHRRWVSHLLVWFAGPGIPGLRVVLSHAFSM